MILFCKVFKPPVAINSRFHIPLDCLNFALLRLNETINVTSHQLKKKKKSDCWFPRASHLTPLPITQSTPSFLSLAGHSHSCSPFLFLFQSTQHTYTHSSPSQSHRYIPHHHIYHFFRQNHQKILKNITPSHKLFEVKVLISFDEYYVLV